MNPRRSTYSSGAGNHQLHQISISTSTDTPPFQAQIQSSTLLSSIKSFLKKPHAFPFLLSVFLLLTWVSLRFQRSPNVSSLSSSSSSSQQQLRKWDTSEINVEEDRKANVMRFPSSGTISPITKDKRGWLLDPIAVALRSGIPGGARICASLHVGEIQPGSLRGNHRHYTCNETFLIWGAKTKFRLENNAVDKGFAEVIIGEGEVAVAVSPSGTAHALVNMDPVQTTFFLGCQDDIINYNSSTSDFNVWKDL